MPDTNTAVLDLVKPEVGASTDSWGPKINNNFDDIDALFTDPAKKMLKLVHGGTGADTAAGARTALGLGALATLGTVGAAQIDSNAVTTAKIADANVTSAKIADGNVTSAKIADGNVTSAKIADANVTTSKIADANVTTAKIADANVTLAKLGGDITTAGKALLDDADAAAQRTTLGLGTAATRNISVGTTAPSSPSTNDLWVDTN